MFSCSCRRGDRPLHPAASPSTSDLKPAIARLRLLHAAAACGYVLARARTRAIKPYGLDRLRRISLEISGSRNSQVNGSTNHRRLESATTEVPTSNVGTYQRWYQRWYYLVGRKNKPTRHLPSPRFVSQHTVLVSTTFALVPDQPLDSASVHTNVGMLLSFIRRAPCCR